MNIRLYEPEDYEQVAKWWEGYKFGTPIPEAALPTDGLIIDGVCAAWVYLSSNSNLCRLGWPISNPEAPRRSVYKGLREIILRLHELAASEGCPLMEASFNHPALQRMMTDLEFQTGDKDLICYVKSI